MNITSAKYMKDPMTGKNASIDIIINNEKLCVPLDLTIDIMKKY